MRFFQYSILSIKDSTPQALAAAKVYYNSIDLAFQICREFVAAERGNAELLEPLEHASKLLERIVAHNALLKSSDVQPAWPRHEALLRFDLPLQHLTSFFFLAKKWKQHYCVLRGRYLYCHPSYNTGCCSSRVSVHPVRVAFQDTLARMLSNPIFLPDGHYCADLQGMRAPLIPVSSARLMLLRRLQRCAVQRGGRRAGVRLRDQVPRGAEGACMFFQHVRAHHTACCRLRRTCAWLPPTT